MFDHKHYVPILKGKAGEYRALRDFAASHRFYVTPLVEIPPVGWDFKNSKPLKGLADHIKKVADNLGEGWGSDTPLFLDSLLPGAAALPNGGHHLAKVLADTRAKGLKVVPVTGLSREAVYQTTVRAAVAKDRLGVCMRLRVPDLAGDTAALDAALAAELAKLDVTRDQVDVLLDLGPIMPGQGATMAVAAQAIIAALPQLQAWRTVTLAATAFPLNLSAFKTGTITPTERAEWTMWKFLASGARQVPRIPSFGDYAIQHPEPVEGDPRIMKPGASIRYTTDSDWLIVKGPEFKKNPQVFRTQCKKLIARSECYSQTHCKGDDFIRKCAAGTGPVGNLTTWRQVGTVHHMTVVAAQIASLP